MPTPMLLLGVFLIGGVLLYLIYISQGADDAPLQERLAEIASRDEPVSLEEIELSLPFTDRILRPMIRGIAGFASRFTPSKSVADVQHKLDLAGNPAHLTPTEFLGIRTLSCVGLGVGSLILFTVMHTNPVQRFMFGALIGVMGYLLPTLWLSSRIKRRQSSIQKALPDALDLLTICVEAGLGFDAAMAKVNQKWDNELSRAFGRVIQEIRLGKLRREALREMANRMEVQDITTFVAALIQADQLGVSIAKILRIQADQMRIKRRQRAEEQGHRAPLKMIFPMVFLIFPSIWIILLGPAAILVKNSGALNVVK